MPTIGEHQYFIYLYDLPKQDTSSIKIAEKFKTNAGLTIGLPQIKRDMTKPFWTAIVKIDGIDKDEDFKVACEKMRYFEIEGADGTLKQCRALPFDKQLLGTNKDKLNSSNSNVFVRNIPKDIKLANFEKEYEKFGKVKSLKISFNPDHSSRGYGFITFMEEDAAKKAVESLKEADTFTTAPFEPKEIRGAIRKLVNNIYFKNIPAEMTDAQVKEIFAPFGTIKSLVLFKNDIGQFGFVCYADKDGKNREYGPECCQKAISELQNRVMGKDAKGNDMKLYVRHALKKADRQLEKTRDTIRYKASKKRCNLYVKNFPTNWTEDDLRNLFQQYGEIEKIRLEKGQTGNSYAFVCFKQPDAAATAKQSLSNQTHDGKVLIINHYEIKEVRDQKIQEIKDKSDFEKYKAQQSGGFQWNDLSSHPYLTQIIQQLLGLIQQNEAMNQRMNQGERGMFRGNSAQRRPNQYNQNRNMQQMPQMNQMPQAPGQMPMRPKPMPQPGMPSAPQNIPQMGGMPGAPNMQQIPQNLTPQQEYMMKAHKLLPSITEKNPYYKDSVGNLIYDYVHMIIGPEKAPKITGMLIELPVSQIREIMNSFEALQMKVTEANHLLMTQLAPQNE